MLGFLKLEFDLPDGDGRRLRSLHLDQSSSAASPENMTSIRAMPRHAFGARPGDQYKYKSKDDGEHEGRQDHPFADAPSYHLLHSFSASRRRACLSPQEFFFERIAVARDGRIADL